MNEFFAWMIEGDFFLYAACVAGLLGILIQIILAAVYNQSLRASDSIRNAKAVWMRQMRTRFESFQQWNHGVRNTDVFVDRHIGRRKLLGVYLVTWEEFSRLMVPVSVLLGALGSAFSFATGKEQTETIFPLAAGTMTGIVLKCFVTWIDLKEKRTILRMNLRDYFENVIQRVKPENHSAMNSLEAGRLQESGISAESRMFAENEASAEDRKFSEDIVLPEASELQVDEMQTELACAVQRQIKGEAPERVSARRREAKKSRRAIRMEQKQDNQRKKAERKIQKKQEKERLRMEKLHQRVQKMQQRLGEIPETKNTAAVHFAKTAATKEEVARAKREELKRKVDIPEEEEDKIISEVLKEFLA